MGLFMGERSKKKFSSKHFHTYTEQGVFSPSVVFPGKNQNQNQLLHSLSLSSLRSQNFSIFSCFRVHQRQKIQLDQPEVFYDLLEHTAMVHMLVYRVFLLLYLRASVISSLSLGHENTIDSKVLNVGEELQQESIPLQSGSRLYMLHGLKSSTWYEVKISYPASIPASFSVQLIRGKSDTGFNWKRRLLNTEKLIFKADSNDMLSHQSSDQSGQCALVTVEPAGIVAMPHVQERQLVMFNIVCDELLFGIPHKACWVGGLVLLCLGLALMVPYFLPSHLLRKNQSLHSVNISLSKDS